METNQHKLTVYINDKCAPPCECHSTIIVTADDTYTCRNKANALLWYFAKSKTPEFATYTHKGGIEWANNIRMKGQPIPEKLQPIVDMWAEQLDVQEKPEVATMESHVVDGLNTVFDILAKDYGDLDPQEFIKEVTHYANRWAKDFYQDNQHLY